MGTAASKPAGAEDGYLFQQSTVPISFSNNFVQKLEDSSATEAEREQYIESIVQDRVRAELQRLEDAESVALAERTYELSRQNIASDGQPDLNAVIMEADLRELKRTLQRSSQYAKLNGIEQVEERRKGVISCLLAKKGQSLDCKTEVDAFKESVRVLQKEYIVQYH